MTESTFHINEKSKQSSTICQQTRRLIWRSINLKRITTQNPNTIDHFEFVSRLVFDGNDEAHSDDEYNDLNDENYEEVICEDSVENFAFETQLEQEDNYHDDHNLNYSGSINIQSEEIMEEIEENSPLTYVVDEMGVRRLISKSAYLWMITEPGLKLSNDRQRRFRINSGRKRKANET